ncbi:MFS general substrate transporter [Myriangium duriaei CBS 260.36]|uniref:MFS general substrate transporter n=1 Tax=Myriangium duriaei CBS 260.36 TaxID=1168546 RepID=A0A9P4ITQ0_9PEZI|nr:MFS general substrate transporter [Myriangium duriaei CBS 260.36]
MEQTPHTHRSSDSDASVAEKATATHVEQIHTNERVPGHTNYYEKGGLRTYGDGEDHDHEPPMSFKRFMSFVAMAFLWTASQIPVYLFGGIPPIIYGDIGGADRWIWFVLGNLLALAGVCPFVGSLSDILGRRHVALIGGVLIIIGMIVASTAHEMNTFIGGMTIAGAGAGINELTALAAVSEMAPTAKRGKYVAILIFTITPFCPSVLYGQLIAAHTSWRFVGLICGIWAFIGVALTAIFYFPPPRPNSQGMTNREIIKSIDFLGGFLSIAGFVLFMAGMQWGGYQYAWSSPHVLAPLILGGIMLVAFFVWQRFAKNPMYPHRLRQNSRVLGLTLVITFISGANFFSILMFWPTQAFNVYGHDPVGVGIRGLPVGFAILTGAFVNLLLLTFLKGKIRLLMIISSILMTAGCGALSIARTDNLGQLWGILILAGLGIGGIVVPASIISTIIVPDDLIATVTALTLAIRVLGGSVGYCIYYNVFISKFVPILKTKVGTVLVAELHITNFNTIVEAITLTGASLIQDILYLPGIDGNVTAYNMIVAAGQAAYAEGYKYVYYVSIAFGAVSIVAACFLGDISQYMDDHVAVVIH